MSPLERVDHLVDDGVVPFLIDWGMGPHPATSAPGGAKLVDLRLVHPEPARGRAHQLALGLAFDVEPGARPGLVATLRTPTATVEIL